MVNLINRIIYSFRCPCSSRLDKLDIFQLSTLCLRFLIPSLSNGVKSSPSVVKDASLPKEASPTLEHNLQFETVHYAQPVPVAIKV